MYDISKKIVNVVVIIIVLSLVIYFNKRNKDHILYELNNNNSFESYKNKKVIVNNENVENIESEEKPFIKPEEILETKKETASNNLFDIKTVEDVINNKVKNDPKNLTQMNCKYFNLYDDKLNIDLLPKNGELFMI